MVANRRRAGLPRLVFVNLDDEVAAGRGMRSEDVADAFMYMLQAPRHITIRDLVMLPTNQEI